MILLCSLILDHAPPPPTTRLTSPGMDSLVESEAGSASLSEAEAEDDVARGRYERDGGGGDESSSESSDLASAMTVREMARDVASEGV